jgi:flavin reductase (DIM6/NTAB) family NADH-FMN oxidoreductase RutF
MSVTPEAFRNVLGHLAGGVTVVTSVDPEGVPSGLTATAVCSVSLVPPLVMACVSRDSSTHAAVISTDRYALNFLSAGSRLLADRFASAAPDKFEGVDWSPGVTGCPVLDEAMAFCECTVPRSVDAGDHTIFFGRVERAEARTRLDEGPADALVHYRGDYAVTRPLEP